MAKIGTGENSLSRPLKTMVGVMLMRLFPSRRQRVERLATIPWHANEQPGVIDRLIRQGVFWSSSRDASGRELAALHQHFWTHQRADEYYEGTATRFDEVFLPYFDHYLDEVNDLMRANDIANVVEIGCGDGQLLRHMRQRLPADRLVGLDLSVDQIERNKRENRDPGIEYYAGDAAEWIDRCAPAHTLFVTGLGVLEYFPQSALQTMLQKIASKCAPSMVFFTEPVDANADYASFDDSEVAGEEHSFTHNYPRRLQQAGFGDLELHSVVVRDYRWDMFFASVISQKTSATCALNTTVD